MRVVLDTNVLLSALISPHGPPDTIYRAWRAAPFEIETPVANWMNCGGPAAIRSSRRSFSRTASARW